MQKSITLLQVTLVLITVACTDDPSQSRSVPFQGHHAPSIVQSDPTTIAYNLKNKYKSARNAKQLISLDSIARIADGELSEAMGEIATDVYAVDKENFFRAVYSNQLYHLANAFVMGVSAELAVFKGNERQHQLTAFKRDAQRSYRLLPKGVAAMSDTLVSRVDPFIYD